MKAGNSAIPFGWLYADFAADQIPTAAWQICCCLALLYGSAVGLSILALNRWTRTARIVSFGLFLWPLLIEARWVPLRAACGLFVLDAFFKVWARGRVSPQIHGPPPATSFTTELRRLIPFPILTVPLPRGSRPTTRLSSTERTRVLLALFLAASAFAVAAWTLFQLSSIELLKQNFLLDHTLKVLLLPIGWQSLCTAAYSFERAIGHDAGPLTRSPLAASSIADFWRRFNCRVADRLQETVFRPITKSHPIAKRHPIAIRHNTAVAIWATFLFSGVFHELACAVATSRTDGYQLLFFGVQAPAVLVERRLSASFPGNLRRAMTVIWFWLTSMLFFHAVDRVFPFFYAAEPWLP